VGDDREIVLRAKDLVLGYGAVRVLEQVELELALDERWAVVGPNGSGKTTLLLAMLGLLEPLAGTLWRHEEHGRGACVGFVPQHAGMPGSLPTTVREFAWLGLAGLRIPRAEVDERVVEALDAVGLSPLARVDYRALSGGQRQRALLARALVRRPHLLILDEPTEGLDLPSKAALVDLLEQAQERRRMTVVMVTHDLNLAVRTATHAALLGNGRSEAGPAGDVLVAESLSRAYGVPLEVSSAGVTLAPRSAG
jgi:ABC-type Mn2+/Zn2+ transport system ATPase subunit